MMSRRRVVASITTVAMASAGCVASSGAPSSSWFSQDQATAVAPSGAGESSPATRGGGYANEEGPRVSIYTEVENAAGSQLVRANFRLEDDAYVLVGHIDADGVLRISFPETPIDNGFTHGRASYQTAQFFGGFVDQYRARFSPGMPRLDARAVNDSYNGGLGWVFVIASWQPMHFEKFSTGGYWDSFEIDDANFMKDPRPAVYELAALLAGTNASSYTVRFANIRDTQTIYGGRSAFAALNDVYGAQMCSGFGYGFSYGFASTPFGLSSFNPVYLYGYGQPFWWRGAQYLYDSGFDCYYQAGTSPFGYRPRGYGYGWGVIAQNPPTANPGTRLIGINQIPNRPHTPQPGPMRLAPGSATDVGGANGSHMALAPEDGSPQYRTRGLVSHQDPVGAEVLAPRTVGPERRAHDAGNGFQTGGMVIRGNGNNDSRSQTNAGSEDANARRAPSARGYEAPNTGARYTPSSDAPRAAPQQRVESPRTESPHMAPAPAPRVEAPRMETPRMSSPAPSPPPMRVEAPSAPRSAPASPPPASPPPASSSSTGKPPGKN